MSQLAVRPELDENAKVGLAFISVGYGVVLVAVFPMTSLASIGVAGWFHLGLAASMLVISWMGYYDNRQRYAAWRVSFFNIPLFQYLISFGILFAYWELGDTVTQSSPHAMPTPKPEAVIMVIIFIAYLAWDSLEVIVQESEKYARELTRSHNTDLLPPVRQQYSTWRQQERTVGEGRGHGRRVPGPWFAKDVRARRIITSVFVCLYALGLASIIVSHVQGTVAVAVIDSIYIASLFGYRYFQRIWSTLWYRRL